MCFRPRQESIRGPGRERGPGKVRAEEKQDPASKERSEHLRFKTTHGPRGVGATRGEEEWRHGIPCRGFPVQEAPHARHKEHAEARKEHTQHPRGHLGLKAQFQERCEGDSPQEVRVALDTFTRIEHEFSPFGQVAGIAERDVRVVSDEVEKERVPYNTDERKCKQDATHWRGV